MSFASLIVKRVTGSLKLGSPRTKLKGKLRDTKIADLQNPRFTRDQFEKLKTKSTGAEQSAGRSPGGLCFRG
jgi:hypothetical protein